MASINSLMVQGAWDNPIPIPISGTVSTVPAAGGTTTVTGTVTAVPTLTTTVTGQVSATVSGTVTTTPAPATTVTVTGVVTAVPTLTTTVAGTVTVTTTVTVTGTVTATVTGTVTAVPTLTTTVTGTVSASVTNTVSDNVAQWNGVAVSAPVAAGDALANPTAPQVITHPELWDGSSNWVRFTGAVDGTALASAARTVQTQSATIKNYNCRGIICYLNITAASGTGGLKLRLLAFDSAATVVVFLNVPPLSLTATGQYAYMLYPGDSTAGTAGTFNVQQHTPCPLPREFAIEIQVGDASSYTYSVTYSLIP